MNVREREGVGVVADEEGGDLLVPVEDGVHEGRHARRVRRVDRGAALDQLDRL